jgi:hypothetical protein
VYYPLDSSRDVHLTYDREAAIAAIRKFEGRLGDYQPKHPVEEEHLRFPRQIERLRTQVVLTGAESLVTHLGGLKVGRKTLVFVTEGFTPAGYEGDAFALQQDIQETYEAANRNNVSIFPVDPRGLMMQTPAFQIDGLKALAAETGGRAIVNRNDLRAALSEVSNEAMAYYLLGFVSAHPADGKFHHITVRTKRRKVSVNARNGYWALSDAEIAASRVAPVVVPPGVTDAFKRMAEALRPEEPEAAPKHAMPKPPAPVITLMGMPTFAVVRGRAPLQIATRPEFSRGQRIAIRAEVEGVPPPVVTAHLLDRMGRKLTDLPVAISDGMCDVPLILGSLAPGDYVVQLDAQRDEVRVEQLAALRVLR